MKKLLVILLAMCLMWGTCLAEGMNFAEMTDEQLHGILDAVRNELAQRELAIAENTVLVEQDGVTVYLTGKYDLWGDPETGLYMGLQAIVVNESEYNVAVTVESASINGWVVYSGGIGESAAGKKQKSTIDFDLTAAEVTSYEEIEDIEMNLVLYDMTEWETISRVETIILHPNQQ